MTWLVMALNAHTEKKIEVIVMSKWRQNGAKMAPKWRPNGAKIRRPLYMKSSSKLFWLFLPTYVVPVVNTS